MIRIRRAARRFIPPRDAPVTGPIPPISTVLEKIMTSSALPMSGSEQLVRTRELVEQGTHQGLHLGAQIYVSRGARGTVPFQQWQWVVGQRADGLPMEADTLNLWLSATKPVTAVAFGLLWQRGEADLDDPVARFVPEFGAENKGHITLRHVLTHTGGIRMLNLGWPDAGWDEILKNICARRPEPRWPVGAKAGYHLASSWFVLGEVVSRIAGEPFPEFVRRELLLPCGMEESWIGMPEERFHAYGDRIGHMWSTAEKDGVRTPKLHGWHEAPSVVGCSPGGNGRGPMRELGKFYEMLLRKGRTEDGQELLRPQTVEAMTQPHRVGLLDRTFKQKLDWGLGFIVDSKHYGENLVAYGYGNHASRRTFGHSGSQSSTGFADPENDLVVALMVNGQPGEPTHTKRQKALAEAIYEDLGLVESP